MGHVVCSANVNNLFVRYRFMGTFPGDISEKSLVGDERTGYLPQYDAELMKLFHPEQRDLTARAITNDFETYPDVVCLQEVESLIALREFNDKHLKGAYPYALLVDSRDFRQIDVGVLSKLEILSVKSHVDDRTAAGDLLFSRDCLEVTVALTKSGSKTLTLFVNHLKSKFVDWRADDPAAKRAEADAKRKLQATAVRSIVRRRFPGDEFGNALFAVVGDLNDEPASDPVRPLVHQSGLIDALERIEDETARWTHWFRSENSVGQLDYVLLSPALAHATRTKMPWIERRGISFSRYLVGGEPGPVKTHFQRIDEDPNPIDIDFQFERFPEVTPSSYASDHCPVFFEVP